MKNCFISIISEPILEQLVMMRWRKFHPSWWGSRGWKRRSGASILSANLTIFPTTPARGDPSHVKPGVTSRSQARKRSLLLKASDLIIPINTTSQTYSLLVLYPGPPASLFWRWRQIPFVQTFCGHLLAGSSTSGAIYCVEVSYPQVFPLGVSPRLRRFTLCSEKGTTICSLRLLVHKHFLSPSVSYPVILRSPSAPSTTHVWGNLPPGSHIPSHFLALLPFVTYH